MGKEKRILLLAVMVLLMGTNGYGEPIIFNPNGEKQHIKSDMTITGINDNIQFNTGNTKIDVENNKEIIINIEKADEIKTTAGIDLSNSDGKKGPNNFTNNNSIIINSGIGINLGKTGKVINNKKIEVKNGGVGIDITNKFSTFTNEVDGEITVSGTKLSYDGDKITGGQSSVGIKITAAGNPSGYNKVNKGTINVVGGEKLITYGDKKTVAEAVGVLLNGAGSTFSNDINGTINVIGTENGTFSGFQTKGIHVNNASASAINSGTITAERYGIGVSTKGEFTNKDGATINAINKGVGINSNNGGTAINEGKINVTNGSYGIEIAKNSKGVNKKEIITDGTGNAVRLTNAFFVNSGTIDAGKNGIAIQNIGKDNKGNPLNNTVYLKDGSKITGNIVGAEGIDVLGFGKGTYSGLDVKNYEALTVRDGEVKIENSSIGLEYNKGTGTYLTEANGKMDSHDYPNTKPEDIPSISGNLTISDSTLAINFKDSLTNKDLENPIINVGKDGTLTFEKGITLVLDSSDGRTKFDVYDALGFGTEDKLNGKIELGGEIDEVFNKTVVWNYYKDSNGHLTAERENYNNIVLKSQLNEFTSLLDKQEIGTTELGKAITELETLKTKEEFTKAVTQLSGGLHGYTADIAAVNARTLVNTMRDRALTRDYIKNRPVNSYTQDFVYIDNNHRLGGLMDVNYDEKGVLGITEKQILPNGRIGLVYGGSTGSAKFDGGESGSASLDGIYAGGYYNYEFNDKWSLNSNAGFVYTHNKVTRNVKIGNLEKETFKSNYPIYSVGLGTSLIYTVKDDLRNKAYFYAGIDANRIIQGMIHEDEDKNKTASEIAIRKGNVNDKSYYSIVPSAGFMAQNTGYIFDRKYRIGAGLNWETEIGNIKDGKRLNMKGISNEYKVETAERENVFSYSLFGALDLTENLAVNAKYSSIFSDEYDGDLISAGFEYKIDTMADNMLFGPIISALENRRQPSERWGGTFSIMLENEDDSDRTYYSGETFMGGGDYATSNQYKPKFTLSLNDKLSNWSYYFEGYWKDNDLIKTPKGNEQKQHASRLHGEARWSDSYSKGKYGINVGYRNETSNKSTLTTYDGAKRVQRGVHQLRVTPNFTYELGNGFTFGGGTTGIFEYNYTGEREGQFDYLMENQYGIVYTGFMPRWRVAVNYFREDRWIDNSNTKLGWSGGKYTYSEGPARYQLNQIRPSITYYFGNGGSFKVDARIPFGNGAWYSEDVTDKKAAETYEVRYGFMYYHPVAPGLTANIGGIFVTTKTKIKDHDKDNYGDINRSHSFRPSIGFSYSF